MIDYSFNLKNHSIVVVEIIFLCSKMTIFFSCAKQARFLYYYTALMVHSCFKGAPL